MKKNFPININGLIFNIDEDAYDRLKTYLEQLHVAFPGDEGDETVVDIESRISEIFSEIAGGRGNIITIDDVNNVIERMGQPADLAGESSAKSADSGQPLGEATPPPFPGEAAASGRAQKRLYRDERSKVFGGVIAGLAQYLGWNATAMRIILVVLCLFTRVVPLFIYLIAWMIIPAARTPRQILEMTGQPITVGNVGQTILGAYDSAASGVAGESQNFWSILGKIVLAFIGFIGAIVGLSMIVALAVTIASLIAYAGWGDCALLNNFDCYVATGDTYSVWAAVCFSIAVLLPALACIWGGCNAMFNVKGPSRGTIIMLILLEVVALTAGFVMLHLSLGHCAAVFASSTLSHVI